MHWSDLLDLKFYNINRDRKNQKFGEIKCFQHIKYGIRRGFFILKPYNWDSSGIICHK